MVTYHQVAAQYGATSDITLTGHSLGGGLASLMAVYFAENAVTFDLAPFALSALPGLTFSGLRTIYTAQLQAVLPGLGLFLDANWSNYSSHIDYFTRSARVTGYHLQGESLELGRNASNLYIGSTQAIPRGASNMDGITAHSMTILAAMLNSQQFAEAVRRMPELGEMLDDERLYAVSRRTENQDFMVHLLSGHSAGTPVLANFANNIIQLLDTGGLVSVDGPMRRALTIAALDYYQVTSAQLATSAFDISGGALHLDLGRLGQDLSGLKSPRELVEALRAVVVPSGSADDWMLSLAALGTHWHVQAGAGAVSWTASGSDNDVAVGGAGADTLRGQAGVDMLFGGAGGDTLEGGEQGDYLYGGAGSDTYRFSGQFGNDWIVDSEGSGVIDVAGRGNLSGAGAQRVAAGVDAWVTSDGEVSYTLVPGASASASVLVITVRSDQSTGSIAIRNWQEGGLGISLSGNEVRTAPTVNQFFGDFSPATRNGEYLLNIPAGGNFIYGGPLVGAQDLIDGSVSVDEIYGYDGNDGLSGGGDDDFIDGGKGDDLIFGGSGIDRLLGGEGNDHIFGSDYAGLFQPSEVGFTPPPAPGEVVARGFNWVVYRDPPKDNGDVDYHTEPITGSLGPNGETTQNIIDGGAGDDRISAGTGNDVVHGGADDDYVVGMGGQDSLYGDGGNDQLYGDGVQGEYATFTPLSQHGDDVLDGGDGDDKLYGDGGNDRLIGGAGDDYMQGDSSRLDNVPLTIHGRDFLDGGDGADRMIGGGLDDVLLGAAGNDIIGGDSGGVAPGQVGYLEPTSNGNDSIDGGWGDDQLFGEGGNDAIVGGVGSDYINGDEADSILNSQHHGQDRLDGGEGNDFVYGAGGADTIVGGEGDDNLVGDDTDQRVVGIYHGADAIDGGAGLDTIRGSGGGDTIHGGAGDDTIWGDGPTSEVAARFHGNDQILGEEGNDLIAGGGGDDSLLGGDGNDQLDGDDDPSQLPAASHGDDTLEGGAGEDRLVGGGGSDRLTAEATTIC
jgi:Ca2+-binding RTX toxin-like protein